MFITAEQAKKILLGNYVFTQLGFSLMITRLKRAYATNQDQAVLTNCVNEINAFLKKYESIMANDYAIISML